MKIVLLTALLFASSAYSEEAPEHRDGPCITIMEACKSAGYGKAGSKKSLSKDCMGPLLKGDKVEGVAVNSKDLADCKAKKSELKKPN